MISLLRLLLLLPVAFVAGMLFERNRVAELCDGAGGTMIADVCTPNREASP